MHRLDRIKQEIEAGTYLVGLEGELALELTVDRVLESLTGSTSTKSQSRPGGTATADGTVSR